LIQDKKSANVDFELILILILIIIVEDSVLFWLWSSSQISLSRRDIMNLESLGEDTRSILHLDTGHHHAGSSLSPVHRSGHLPPGGQLETVDHSDDLIEVSAGGGGVEQGQLQSSVWTNDEHSSAGERNTSIALGHRIQHSILLSNLSVGVSNDGVGELSESIVFQNVSNPALVRLHLITRQSNHLDSSLGELSTQCLSSAQLSGADRGVVSGVGEEDDPAALAPVVEINLAMSGGCCEVGDNISPSLTAIFSTD